jgi:hypothetical protein
MRKEYNIACIDNNSSNEFLRCLWSRLRFNFGKLAWNTFPCKISEKQLILIGYIDLAIEDEGNHTITITCTYSKKGCIKTLSWDAGKLSEPEKFIRKFDTSIKEAKDHPKFKKENYLSCTLGQYIKFEKILGRNFSLQNDLLIIKILGYDKEDIHTFSQQYFRIICDYLTFDTIRFINKKNSGIDTIRSYNDRVVSFSDFNSGEVYSETRLMDKFINLNINKSIIDSIDDFLEREFNYDQYKNNFEKSLSMISRGIMFEEMIESKFYLDFSPAEYAVMCYMSALEIITINDIKPLKCDTCNQDIYSIAKRVVSLSENVTDGNPIIKKMISKYYGIRSKFVHTGQFLSSNNYIGTSIPLLSTNSESGLIDQEHIFNKELKFFVKECILWHEANQNETK